MFINKTLQKILLLIVLSIVGYILVLFILEHKNNKEGFASNKKLNKYLEFGVAGVVVLFLIGGLLVYFKKKSASKQVYHNLSDYDLPKSYYQKQNNN